MTSTALTELARDPARETSLARHITTRVMGRVVYALTCVESTMDVARGLAATGSPEGTLVLAARQRKGRGRLGRVWESPEGGLYLSLVLRPSRPQEEWPHLSLVTGLACAEAIREACGVCAMIKWPNDLVIGSKKIGGILLETQFGSGFVVLGIGINVGTPANQLPDTAMSLVAAGATHADPMALTGALCHRVETWYETWAVEGFDPVREALRAWMGDVKPLHEG